MLKNDIGINAGTIWQLLSEKGILSIGELEELTGYKDSMILLALGWLARENKISFSVKGGAFFNDMKKSIGVASIFFKSNREY